MKTVIIYISSHGTTETVSKKIAEKISEEVEIVDLQKNNKIDLTSFDRVILGASIHIGKVHKKTQSFIEKYQRQLLTKELGLFLCCMETGTKAEEQFEQAFPLALRVYAKANAMLGYEYLLEKMGFFEKMMVKKITGKDQSFSKIDEEAIDAFVSILK